MLQVANREELSTLVLAPIACFTLMPYGKDQDGLRILFKAIKRDVTGPAAGYHQLAQSMLDGTAYQWMAPQ